MIFSYLKITPKISRPIITIIVKSQSFFALYQVMIDSGADHCIFDLGLAEKLGITLDKKDTIQLRGVGKDDVEGYWGTVELKIGDSIYQTKVVFANMSDFGHGILGQKGFFDHFDVTMSYRKQIVSLQQNSGKEKLN